jgi:hypothetical protein
MCGEWPAGAPSTSISRRSAYSCRSCATTDGTLLEHVAELVLEILKRDLAGMVAASLLTDGESAHGSSCTLQRGAGQFSRDHSKNSSVSGSLIVWCSLERTTPTGVRVVLGDREAEFAHEQTFARLSTGQNRTNSCTFDSVRFSLCQMNS